MSNLISEKVKKMTMKAMTNKNERSQSGVSEKLDQDQENSQLIKYRPKKSDPSLLLNDFQISNLSKYIPGIYKRLTWKLLYRLNEHGSSMHNFYKNVKGHDVTLMIVMDRDGWKFGSLNF